MSLANQANKTEASLKKLPIIGEQPKNESEEKYLREICEYEFFNLKEPNVSVTFPYGDTNNHHTFILFHGGKYRFPRFLARHIESRSTPIWDWTPDGTGRMVKKLVGSDPRFSMRQKFGG